MTSLSKAGRSFGPHDRRKLLEAIGAGQVHHAGGRDWRRTGANHGIVKGGVATGRVPVARAHLEQLADEGLVRLGPDDVWQLTYAGGLHAPAGAA